jgi:hypothetical protein
MSIVGKTYLERGQPVEVLVQWALTVMVNGKKSGGPRNVLIRRADGTRVVRPFRGLRKRFKNDEYFFQLSLARAKEKDAAP